MKFIHTADVHLGASPDRTMPWTQTRARELWDTFYKLLDEVSNKKVDFLFIAGDLFHRTPLLRELREINARFEALSGTRVVLMAGNHDYIGNDSPYDDFEWAANVSMFRKSTLAYMYFEDMNAIIYGMSYRSVRITEPVYERLRPMKSLGEGRVLPADCAHILLAHGGDADHIPIDMNRLGRAGFDYVALGHIHKPWISEKFPMAYCGALEPIDSADEGQHGYVYGEIGRSGTRVEFVPFAGRSYVPVTVDISDKNSMFEITETIREETGKLGRRNIYKLTLTGTMPQDLVIDEYMLRKCGNILSTQILAARDNDYEQLRIDNKGNIIGICIDNIMSRNLDESTKEKALAYAVNALLGKEQL